MTASVDDIAYVVKTMARTAVDNEGYFGDLDSVVQSVLTDQSANIPALLQAANPIGQASIAAGNASS